MKSNMTSFACVLVLVAAATFGCRPPASPPPEPKASAAVPRTYPSRGDGTSRLSNSLDVVKVEGEPYDPPADKDDKPRVYDPEAEKSRDKAAPETKAAASKAETQLVATKSGGDRSEVDPAAAEPTPKASAESKGAEAPPAAGEKNSEKAAEKETEKETEKDAKKDEAQVAQAAAQDSQLKKSTNKVLLGSPELTAGIPGRGPVTTAELDKWLADSRNHEVLEVQLPLGLAAGAGQITGLDKNPLTRAKIELGRQLYFDKRLSADESVSCASCHDPAEGYTRHTRFGIGIRQIAGGRNSPVSYNRILSGAQFWDGRADSLEDQAIGPIANAIEMGNTHDACVACLKRVKGYRVQFEKIFGKLDIHSVGMALASFERTIVSGPSPFDYDARFRLFDDQEAEDLKEDPELMAQYQEALAGALANPMSESAKRGRVLFFSDKVACTACHVGANLTDEKYHNLGIGMEAPKPDLGRFVFSMQDKDRGAFKTPTIRNVALSAPYMHDGSIKTLEEVVEWYSRGGHPNPWLSDRIKKLDLTAEEKNDLVEFMKACTGAFPKVDRARLPT